MSRHLSRGAIIRWLPALAVMAVIFLLSSQSGLRVSDDAAVDRPFRVAAHLGTYALLAAVLFYALVGDGPLSLRAAIGAWGIAVLFGLSDEFHQSFVVDRTGSVDDLAVDAVGAFVGVAIAWLALPLWQRHVTRRKETDAARR